MNQRDPFPAAPSNGKVVQTGTHRVRSGEDTLRWITPLLPRFGITRLADITWLDDIGLPVYQAVRPGSYLLSVSQGKGVTRTLAKVSAVMEAVEGWHAERPAALSRPRTVADVEPGLGYRIAELNLLPRNHLNPQLRLRWSVARRLTDGGDTLVPTAYLRLDGRVGDRWTPRLFAASSNGLASGNTVTEATLHGLYEVVERDALPRGPVTRIDADSVDGAAADVLELLRAAEVAVVIEQLPSPLNLPCFRALIRGDAFPAVFEGSGCHLDANVALCRALTEAAQSRLTTIAGTRDDMSRSRYPFAWKGSRTLNSTVDGPTTRFGEIVTEASPSLEDDLDAVVERIRRYTGRAPLVVDHTRADLGVPVVHVVCPGLRHGGV